MVNEAEPVVVNDAAPPVVPQVPMERVSLKELNKKEAEVEGAARDYDRNWLMEHVENIVILEDALISAKSWGYNSDSYSDMMWTLRDYRCKVAGWIAEMNGSREGTNSRREAEESRKELLNNVINYVKNKPRIRKKEYGRKRFDVAMILLYELDPKIAEDFVNKTNTKFRDASNQISIEGLVAELHLNPDGGISSSDVIKKIHIRDFGIWSERCKLLDTIQKETNYRCDPEYRAKINAEAKKNYVASVIMREGKKEMQTV